MASHRRATASVGDLPVCLKSCHCRWRGSTCLCRRLDREIHHTGDQYYPFLCQLIALELNFPLRQKIAAVGPDAVFLWTGDLGEGCAAGGGERNGANSHLQVAERIFAIHGRYIIAPSAVIIAMASGRRNNTISVSNPLGDEIFSRKKAFVTIVFRACLRPFHRKGL